MFIATADEITFTVHLVARCPEARRFAADPVLADLCHDLVGDDVRLYWDQAVYKKPEPAREFPWHQDNGYAFLEPQQYLTCWVPLTDATVDNGCPWVVPGVHRLGTLQHEPSAVGLQCLIDAPDAVAIEASVGDVVDVLVADAASDRSEHDRSNQEGLHRAVRRRWGGGDRRGGHSSAPGSR